MLAGCEDRWGRHSMGDKSLRFRLYNSRRAGAPPRYIGPGVYITGGEYAARF
jgi:hypothetical protein